MQISTKQNRQEFRDKDIGGKEHGTKLKSTKYISICGFELINYKLLN